MSILEKVKTERLKSRKNKNPARTSLLTTLLGEFERKHKSISDQDAMKIVNNMKSNIIDTIHDLKNRGLSVTKEEEELGILDEFEIEEISADELLLIKSKSSHIGEFMKNVTSYSKDTGKFANMGMAKKVWNIDD